MKHRKVEEEPRTSRVPRRVAWVLWGIVRVVATLVCGTLLAALVAFWALPLIGAALVMNAGVTSGMNIVTSLIMVIIPELFCGGIAIAAIVWVTRGVWSMLGTRMHAHDKEREL